MNPIEKNGKTNIIVREFKPKDFEEVIDNYYNIYDEVKQNPWAVGILLFEKKPSLKDERKWFKEALEKTRNGDGFALVAEVNGKVIGMCDVRNKTPQQEQRHIGNVGICIRDGYRSMGIGSALLSELINRAKTKYKILILTLFSSNQIAKNLYEKFGFVEYGNLPEGILRNGKYKDEIYMYLKL
jgi:RimJ/RimL family protein N-acetyltransferase